MNERHDISNNKKSDSTAAILYFSIWNQRKKKPKNICLSK